MAMMKDARTGESLGQVYEATFRDHPSSMCVLRMHDLTFVAANPAFERASGRPLAFSSSSTKTMSCIVLARKVVWRAVRSHLKGRRSVPMSTRPSGNTDAIVLR